MPRFEIFKPLMSSVLGINGPFLAQDSLHCTLWIWVAILSQQRLGQSSHLLFISANWLIQKLPNSTLTKPTKTMRYQKTIQFVICILNELYGIVWFQASTFHDFMWFHCFNFWMFQPQMHLPVQPGYLHDRLQACTNNPSANRGAAPISHEGVGHPRLQTRQFWSPTVDGGLIVRYLGCIKLVEHG